MRKGDAERRPTGVSFGNPGTFSDRDVAELGDAEIGEGSNQFFERCLPLAQPLLRVLRHEDRVAIRAGPDLIKGRTLVDEENIIIAGNP